MNYAASHLLRQRRHDAARPARVEAMRPYWATHFGNPSSLHGEGRQARAAVETARAQVAELLGAEPGEIVFTSGGTEANNLAIQGVVENVLPSPFGRGARGEGTTVCQCHVITSAIEHPAVLACCARLERAAWR